MAGIIYVASPYSGTKQEHQYRFDAVEGYVALLILKGELVFSPIVHCHALASKYNLPTDFDFWQHYCIGMLQEASTLRVLQLPGWYSSAGVNGEIKAAQDFNIPIEYINPITFGTITHDNGNP